MWKYRRVPFKPRRTRQPSPLHLRRRPRRTRRWLGVATLVLVALGAVALRVLTLRGPSLVGRAVVSDLRFPGTAPRLAWPSQGEAALAVSGIGPLGSSGPSSPVPIASVAKVMTAYVVLEDHPLQSGQNGFEVTVSRADALDYQRRAAQAQSVVAVAQGEKLSERQLLEGLLVPSGNNFAQILAVADAGSVSAFVDKMNAAAKRLGMSATHYADPSGLDPATVSDAQDQLKLAEAAMANPTFAHIVAMPAVDLPVAGTVANYNKLLGTDGFVGIKTGSDGPAGGDLVFADDRDVDGVKVVIYGVVLDQDVGQVLTAPALAAAQDAARALADSATTAVSVRTVLPAHSVVAEVFNAQGVMVPVVTSAPLTELGVGQAKVTLRVSLARLGHRLVRGQQVAAVSYVPAVAPADSPSQQVPAVAASSMPAVSVRWRLLHLF